MKTVRDVMTSDVVVVPSNSSVEEAGRILVENNMSGAPVVDEDGRLVGIISEFQLLELVYEPRLKYSCVRDFMTRDVLTVSADDSLNTVANMFILHRIRRLPVVENGRLQGIITRGDVLRQLLHASLTRTTAETSA